MSHPTIRHLAGASAPQQLDGRHTALLVIDFQNEYFSGKLPIPDGLPALNNARRLVAFADQHGLPVFHIQHVAPVDSPVFAAQGNTVRFHDQLLPASHHSSLQKSSVSVFPSTDLDTRLKAAGINTLLISGLMTHACVAAAARDAVPLGYNVIVAADACASRSLDDADGVLPHQQLHRAALASIDDTFGDVLTTAQILQLPVQ